MSPIFDIRHTIELEFARFEQDFEHTVVEENNPLLEQVWAYVVSKRGKQLRPQLVLLSAGLCRDITDKTIESAVALELLHTASLIHDDVVDDSPMRRGSAAVHTRFSNKVAILAGDYLLAKVIEKINNVRNTKILALISQLGYQLSSGEILQLHANSSPWISYEQYFRVIEQKTATLFSACAEVGALSTGATERQVNALRKFGTELGICFQLQDDVLDYSESEELGKPTMNDIRDGKATLPLLVSLDRAPKAEADDIRAICEQLNENATNGRDDNENETEQRIRNFVLRYDGIGYARKVMQEHKKKAAEALSVFRDSKYKQALMLLLDYSINRIK